MYKHMKGNLTELVRKAQLEDIEALEEVILRFTPFVVKVFKMKTTAAEQELFNVVKQIENLLGKPLSEFIREDESGTTNV